ncbi:MAG: hypothetical protein IT357_03230 [Gemmatimonadaceae bacterium]|nr:hypothetical protein [Gemmatimonadaceae bacterium]
MTRRSLLPAVLGFAFLFSAGASSLLAQVGHSPSASPYTDLRGSQAVTFAIGSISPQSDPAGVGPGSGMLLSARHDLRVTGPLWLYTRLSYAPSLTRTVKDPLLTGAARIVGESKRPLMILESGFQFNITGNKSWKRLAPYIHTGFGVATGGTGKYDVGGYRFGTKFIVNYGVGTRIATGSAWELQADLTQSLWQYKYPNDYGGDGTINDESILGLTSLNVWRQNLRLSVGVSRYFFR